jgi:hypothetical protein
MKVGCKQIASMEFFTHAFGARSAIPPEVSRIGLEPRRGFRLGRRHNGVDKNFPGS